MPASPASFMNVDVSAAAAEVAAYVDDGLEASPRRAARTPTVLDAVAFGSYTWLRSKAFASLFLVGLWAAQGYRIGAGINLAITHPAFYWGLSVGSSEAFASDWRNIAAGKYRMPYDMRPSHRQYSAPFIMARVGRRVLMTSSAIHQLIELARS